MPLNGGNLSTRSSLTRNIETHGSVRAQNVSTQVIRGENCTMDTGTFTTTNTETLTVSNGITTPRITLTGAGGSVILATDASAYTGSDSVLIGSTSSAADNTIIIGTENTITAAGEFSVVIGHNNKDASTVDGDHNIILGQGDVNGRSYNVLAGFGNSVATGDFSVVLGRDASSSGGSNTVLGNGANVDDDDCVAIGTGAAVVGAPFGVSIGLSSSVTGENGVSIGADCTASGESAFVAGKNATASGTESLALGKDATASTFGGLSLGRGSTVSGQYAIAVGSAASTSGTGVAVGKASTAVSGVSVGADTSCESGLAVGQRVTSVGSGISVGNEAYCITSSVAVGYRTSALIQNSVSVGTRANCGGEIKSLVRSGTGTGPIVQLVMSPFTRLDTDYVITFTSALGFTTDYDVTVGGEFLGSGVADLAPSTPTEFVLNGRVEVSFGIAQGSTLFVPGDVLTVQFRNVDTNSCVSIGRNVQANDGSVVVGQNIFANNDSVVIGNSMQIVNQTTSVMIGSDLRGSFDGAVAVGFNCYTYDAPGDGSAGERTVVIGYTARSYGHYGIAIGTNNRAGPYSITLGNQAGSAYGKHCVWIGTDAGRTNNPGGRYNTAVGFGAMGGINTGYNNICIGRGAGDSITDGNDNVCVGFAARCDNNCEVGISIGKFTDCESDYSICIGYQGLVNFFTPNSIAIGSNATVQRYADRSVAIGSNSTVSQSHPDSVVLGSACSTRLASELCTRGMRIVRATASGDLSSATTLIDFPITTSNEVAEIEATVTVYDATGSLYVVFCFKEYLFANDGTTTLAIVSGTDSTRSTAATTDTCTLTANATTETARLTFTASDTNSRSVVATMRIHAGGLT